VRVTAERASGYWYEEQTSTQRGVRVLEAMRDYRAAETAMRKRTRVSMGMGETDLLAIRLLLAARREGATLSPKDLARGLGISSASTTILVDRLERSGHVVRQPHPTDRRAIVIETTDATNVEVRHTLGSMHARMAEVAASLSPEQSSVVLDFLVALRRALDEER
jgi:DNA-binding MarR family transcriptional regulator